MLWLFSFPSSLAHGPTSAVGFAENSRGTALSSLELRCWTEEKVSERWTYVRSSESAAPTGGYCRHTADADQKAA